jgi:hypothetical protein
VTAIATTPLVVSPPAGPVAPIRRTVYRVPTTGYQVQATCTDLPLPSDVERKPTPFAFGETLVILSVFTLDFYVGYGSTGPIVGKEWRLYVAYPVDGMAWPTLSFSGIEPACIACGRAIVDVGIDKHGTVWVGHSKDLQGHEAQIRWRTTPPPRDALTET